MRNGTIKVDWRLQNQNFIHKGPHTLRGCLPPLGGGTLHLQAHPPVDPHGHE